MKKLMIVLVVMCLTAGQSLAGTLAPGLEDLLRGKSDDEVVKVLVLLKEQPDMKALDLSLSIQKASRAHRHATVVNTLKDAAAKSGHELLAALEASKSTGGVVGYKQHWIVNSVVLHATVGTVRSLALRDDVERIEPDLEVMLIEPVEVKPAPAFSEKKNRGFLAPGLPAINAPKVWRELGIDGTGSLVANLDSGVDVTHEALGSRWRGNFASASACWQDGANIGSPLVPYDGYGHGTHTMGTMTGVTAYDTVGVAPGAQWIASNGVAASTDIFDNAVLAAFEWFADPDGNPETLDDVPDVVQNSWGVRPEIGPYLDCDSRWWDVMDNCEAAGVVLVWSAGNEGPGFETLNSPGNRADTPTSAFSVGSTQTYAPFNISNFSSRGPSQCGGPFAIKPEVSAPGSDILSCVPGNGYSYMSGTSMAGPHVAGVVALMRQANPDIEVTTIKEILMETSRDLGSAGEDNTYGHGLIDAYAAVLIVLNESGSVAGVVTDADTGLPVAGATISQADGYVETVTAADGSWDLTIRSGPTDLLVEKFGYIPTIYTINIPAGGVASGDLSFPPTVSATVSGTVLGPDDQPVTSAMILVQNTPLDPLEVDENGAYSILLPAYTEAAYTLVASAPGLAYDLRCIGLQADTVLDFRLTEPQSDGFESGGFQTLAWQLAGDVVPTVTSTEASEGNLSAQSGAIDHSQTSELKLDYYANGGGAFSFWYMTESEPAYDTLKFYLDGQLEGTWSGETPWNIYSTNLATGLHELRWVYTKDSSASYLRDAAWIDLVSLPGTGVQPFAQIILQSDAVDFQIDAGTVPSYPFLLSNAGGYPLTFSTRVAEAGDPVTAEPTWFTVSPDTGIVYPGSTALLDLNFDGFAAPAGIHQALLTILSNDPDSPETSAMVTLTVDPVSSVGDRVPEKLTLSGAVPNPFNPSTAIEFSVPAAGQVALKIYDVSGRLVRTLLETRMDRGWHDARWNGCDNAGREVASGVFFARLQVAGETRIKPMTLVR